MSLPVVVPPLPAEYEGLIITRYDEIVSTHWFRYEHIAHVPLRKPAFVQFRSPQGCDQIGNGMHTVFTFTHCIIFSAKVHSDKEIGNVPVSTAMATYRPTEFHFGRISVSRATKHVD